jgi:hypothetical protein
MFRAKHVERHTGINKILYKSVISLEFFGIKAVAKISELSKKDACLDQTNETFKIASYD